MSLESPGGLPHAHAADHDGSRTGQHTRILQRVIVVGHDVALRVDTEEVPGNRVGCA
jgi:hypothetical protein